MMDADSAAIPPSPPCPASAASGASRACLWVDHDHPLTATPQGTLPCALHPHNAHLTQHAQFAAWEGAQDVCVSLPAQPQRIENDGLSSHGMCAFDRNHLYHHHHHHYHHHYHHQWTVGAQPVKPLQTPYPQMSPFNHDHGSVSPAMGPCVPTNLANSEEDLYVVPQTKPKRATKYSISSNLCPPLPSLSAPPYILCQHCSHLLFVPPWSSLDVTALLIKLRCAVCKKVSVFSVLHPQKRDKSPSLNEGESKISLARAVADGGGPQAEQDPNNVDMVLSNATPAKNNGGALASTASTWSPPKLDPEFFGFTSVQDWVNSLAQECFMDCSTPSLGGGLGSDCWRPQGPLDWLKNGSDKYPPSVLGDRSESDKHPPAVPGAPLHEHFGYKTPAELLGKAMSCGDDVKARLDAVSTTSTSAMCTDAFNILRPPALDMWVHGVHIMEENEAKQNSNLKKVHPCNVSFLDLLRRPEDMEQEDQVSFGSMLKRLSSIGLPEERRLAATSSLKEGAVVVNGHVLSSSAIKRAEERAGKLYPGTYWYDSKAGFWGVVGGPCMGVLPPFIEDLDHRPMARDCSNGDTGVFVNGRELHKNDLAILVRRGLSRKPGNAYSVGFDGVIFDETSGQELKYLRKLAPTVECRGKGFGMYTIKRCNDGGLPPTIHLGH